MTAGESPFWASVLFPLARPLAVPMSRAWVEGPFAGTSGAPHVTGDDRTRFYTNPGPARRLLDRPGRQHRIWPDGLRVDGVPRLIVDAAEIVPAQPIRDAPPGYAVLHLRGEDPEITAFSSLADVVRPARASATRLLSAVYEIDNAVDGFVKNVPRGTSLVLSGWPEDESRGLLRWPGSTALDRRLATMVTLPDSGRDLPLPFGVPRGHPTPSYVIAWSSPSIGAVRCRPIDASHVDELRTLWLDAVMIEVRQRDVAAAFASAVTTLANTEDQRAADGWGELETSFRAWRARSAWQATTDHAMEQALAGAVRSASGTDPIIARVEQELHDNSEAEIRRGAGRLTLAVVALTVASLVSPLLLHLASNGSGELRDAAWIANAVVAVGVIATTAAVAIRAYRRS